MTASGVQWPRMREEFRMVVRDELSHLRADLWKDIRQELLWSRDERLTSAAKEDDDPQNKVSNGAACNDPLRHLASFPALEETEGTLPGQPDDTGGVLPSSSHPRDVSRLALPCNQASKLSIQQLSVQPSSQPDLSKEESNSSCMISPKTSKRFRKKRVRKPRLQQAMGLVPDIEREFVNVEGSTLRKLEDLVRHRWLEYLSMAVIFMSTVLIGVTSNHRATNLTQDTPIAYRLLDIVFFIYFAVEIILRCIVFHRRFFTVFGWGWNLFDVVLVFFQFIEEVVAIFGGELASGQQGWPGLRIIRALRTVRCVRMMKLTLYASELRLLASCVVHCFSSFCWATLFLGLVIYILGVYFTDSLVHFRIKNDQGKAEELDLGGNFGSVPRSCVSLLQALTGGMDWDILLRSLTQVNPWFGSMFILYILFGSLAVLNLVTGLFVNGAMERAQAVKDIQRLFQAHKLFAALDADGSNGISEEELMWHINDDAVQEFLNCVDMDKEEVRVLFEILDKDGGGSIDFEEFVTGLLRIHGTATARDLLLMNHEVRALFRNMQQDSRRTLHRALSRPGNA